MISIDAVVSGLKCECVCPSCGGALIAAKGEVYRHHFRHHVEQQACWNARETALHRYAKQVICESRELDYPHWHRGFEDRLFPVELGRLRAVSREIQMCDGGVRADVLAEFERENVAVEIFVAHRVDGNKVQRFADYRLAAIEIDLRNYLHADKSEAEWREIVLREAPRYWVNPPQAVRDAEDVLRRQWLVQQQQMEKAARAMRERLEAERLEQQRQLDEMTEEDRRRREQIMAVNAARAAEHAAERHALGETERVRRETERFAQAERDAALQQQRQRERQSPDLQALVSAHDGYDKIPPEAWVEHDRAMTQWRHRLLGRSAMTVVAPVVRKRPRTGARLAQDWR